MLYPDLSPMPAAYRSSARRTRAADIGEGGRRAGNPEDGNLDLKDMLPAYDNVGGPPKYVELAMDAGVPLHLDLAGAVRERSRPDLERDTPLLSAEEVASSSHSDTSRRSSAQSEPVHHQPQLEAPNPDPPVALHPS
jgi:hypothetical protein